MPFTRWPYGRFPHQCSLTYNDGLFQRQSTVWNLSCTGWRLSGDQPMRPREALSLTITPHDEQHIEIPQSVVRWSRGQGIAMENLPMQPKIQARFHHYMKWLVREPAEITPMSDQRDSAFFEEATVSNMW